MWNMFGCGGVEGVDYGLGWNMGGVGLGVEYVWLWGC